MRYDKYEKRGALHWDEYRNNTYYKKLVDESLAPFKEVKSGSVLDLGCGDGLVSQLLYMKGLDVTGIDSVPLGIEYAEKMCSDEIELITIYAEDFVKHLRSFDYLYSLLFHFYYINVQKKKNSHYLLMYDHILYKI